MLRPDEKPDVNYADIGGLDMQKQEVREAVELPLTHGELYQQVRFHKNSTFVKFAHPFSNLYLSKGRMREFDNK